MQWFNTTHSSKYMILLEYLHDMDENVTHLFPLLEPSLTSSCMPKPNVRKHHFQNKRFLFLKTSYRISVKSIGQPSKVNCLVILRNSHGSIFGKSPRQFFGKSSFEISFTAIFLFLSCHALTPIFLGCPGAYEMHYVNFI